MNCDDAFVNIKAVCEKYSDSDYNESDTRAKIIDVIIKDCLGFPEDYITRETKVHSGYTDYIIKKRTNYVCVIEAKKQGASFNLPVDKRRYYKINGIISSSDNVISAIEQVQKYCIDIGCQYAIISNGSQFIAFKAICIGKSWRDGNAYCFYSLNDIKENFIEFFNEFSLESYEKGNFLCHLSDKITLKFHKISNHIHNIDEQFIRNKLYLNIKRVVDIFLGELLDDNKKEILKACYISENNLKDGYKDLVPKIFQPYRIKEASSFSSEYARNSYKNEFTLMLLLGGVGSGKSTFIHRFFKIHLKDAKYLIWFYIDFRDCLPNESEIKRYIIKHIFKIWTKNYASIFSDKEFKYDPKNESASLLELFEYLKENKYSISLVIDNVDQHDKSFQEKLFIKSNEITKEFEITTILAIREETFQISTKTGVFDAYNIPIFHVPSPNFLDLVLKRLECCIEYLHQDKVVGINDNKDKNDIIVFFKSVKTSLLSKNNQAIKLTEFIQKISIGNMRNALDMFNKFLASGNVNIYEILTEDSYQIAYHQFLKAIILADYKYYKGDRSAIINLFDFDSSITNSHFNCLRLLNYLDERINRKTAVGRGFIKIDEIVDIADEVSIKKEVIIYCIEILAEKYLIELDNQSRKDINSASYIKITSAGKFYLDYLSNTFIYLSLVYIDTPISDDLTFEILRKNNDCTGIADRLAKAKIFVNYLKYSEENEFQQHPEYSSNNFTSKMFGSILVEKFDKEQENIINNSHKKHEEKYILP